MFKTVLQIAYKNIFLQKRRAFLLIAMIGVSMGIMVALKGLYMGMSSRMIDKSIRSDSGEISLYAKNYRLEHSLSDVIANAKEKSKQILALNGVDEVVYRLSVEGLTQTATKAKPSTIIGISLQDEQKFGDFDKFLEEGELAFGKRGVFVTKEFAKSLKVKLGSKVIFTTQDKENEIQSMALVVKAIVKMGNMKIDNASIFVPRKKLASFLGVDESVGTQIALRTNSSLGTDGFSLALFGAKASDSENLDSFKDRLEKMFPLLEVMLFEELYPQLTQMKTLM